MRILVVAATPVEVAPVTARLSVVGPAAERLQEYAYRGHQIDVLMTGVGMVATAAWSARTLASRTYDQAFNFGVCGSFDPGLPPGRVVHVVSELLPEMGAEDGEAFLTLGDLMLEDLDRFPFEAGRIVNRTPPVNAVLGTLPSVTGITVNTVHGSEHSIVEVTKRCQPQVESMEGAAFLYACLIQRVPCAEVRAVSNVVERRNRRAWRIADAVSALGETAAQVLDAL